MADAHQETVHVHNYWFQVLEDMLLEFEAVQKKSAQELQEMEKRALLAEKQRDDALNKERDSGFSYMKQPPDWKKNKERI